MSGQWGTAKTFTAIDLAAAVATGQPFLGRVIKRQSGVLFIAAEGANQVRLRFDAVWKEKCGDGKERAPFCWYEVAPTLLQKGSVEKLMRFTNKQRSRPAKITDASVSCKGLVSRSCASPALRSCATSPRSPGR